MKTFAVLSLVIFVVGCGGRLETTPQEEFQSDSGSHVDAGQDCREEACDAVCVNAGPDRPYAWCERQGDNCAQFDDAVCGVGYCCPSSQ